MKSLRYTTYLVALLWSLVVFGIFAYGYCGEPTAIYLVVGFTPPAVVGTIALLVEWRVLRGED